MTLDPWTEVASVRTLQLCWSKCNQNKPWVEVANIRTYQLCWSKCQSNIRIACFRGLRLAKNTINIKGIMIYVCEAIAFQHNIAAQNVNEVYCTNRLKREPWHGKLGWLHKTRFHFLVWRSDGGGGGKPKTLYDVLCRENWYTSGPVMISPLNWIEPKPLSFQKKKNMI